jgi:hypothetical protein
MIEIVVLSQPDCHFCEIAEEILGRVGQEYPLTVRKVRLTARTANCWRSATGCCSPRACCSTDSC